MLTLLHTSDWHLGRRLYSKPRYTEFKRFLDWQLQVIREQKVDVLLIAGDIFDTTAPSNQAQNLYYDFLSQVCHTDCRHVIIVAGNHDSASFLDAPKQLLKSFNIHIIGSMTDDPNEEVLTLLDKKGMPELIIMAVPYLRDRDVRTVGSGERLDDKERKLAQGIQAHYQAIADIALVQQANILAETNRTVPIVATGHLFTVGGQTTDDDGVRELYVGSLGSIGAEIFHSQIDYVALGHLHIPQMVGGQDRIRYSGSPIAMGFGESGQQKQVHLVRFDADSDLLNQPLQTFTIKKTDTLLPSRKQAKKTKLISHTSMDLFADETLFEQSSSEEIPTSATSSQSYNIAKLSDTTLLQTLPVPTFQQLLSIKGDWHTIKSSLQRLLDDGKPVWLEVIYDSDTVMGDFKDQVYELVQDTPLEILRTSNLQAKKTMLASQSFTETLEELNEQQVFERCLIARNIPDEQKPAMWARYAEVLESLKEDIQ